MYDEFDERLVAVASPGGLGRHHVHSGVDGKEGADLADLDQLTEHALPPEAGHTVIPDGAEQLLHVGVRDKLQRHEHEQPA